MVNLSLHTVYTETFDARHKWENVLLALGVDDHTIKSIRVNFRNKRDDCYREGLSVWLNGDERSWSQVVKALSAPTVSLIHIAARIRNTYGIPGESEAGDVKVKGSSKLNHDQALLLVSGNKVSRSRQSVKAILVLFILLLGVTGLCCIILSVYYGLKSGQSQNQDITVYRNATVLVTSDALDGIFTASIHFQLTVVDDSAIEICQLDCNGGLDTLPTRSIPIMITKTSKPRISQRRQVKFVNVPFDPRHDNIYLLGGSIMHFSTEKIGIALELYIFLDLVKCTEFLHSSSDNSSAYRSFNLNEANNYTVTMTIPRNDKESYYCGVWVAPPNATFQYTVKGTQIVYSVSSKNALCVAGPPFSSESTCDDDTDSYTQVYCFDVFLKVKSRDVCVFFSRMNDNKDAAANIQIFSTLSNPYFVSFIVILSICFILIVITVVVILVCFVRRRC